MLTAYDPLHGLTEKDTVLLAFSGGIDSSAAAYLTMQTGCRVRAVYMDLLPGKDLSRVKLVAEQLGIPLDILDLSDAFREKVMRFCWEEYAAGRTPNPCAICNPVFKFGVLTEYAKEQGCSALVTGHYAQLHNGMLYRGADRKKDQSYFLFGLREEQLSFSRFPLGAMTKEEVRQMVTELGLPNASDPESQDICFASPELPVGELLRQTFHGEITPGVFTDMNGNTLGKHAGIHLYTPGQRKGTGIALGKPAYVRRIIPAEAKVELVTDQSFLMSSGLRFHGLVVHGTLPPSPFRALVQIRYRSLPVPAEITCKEYGTGVIRFETPVRAVTPGQAAVIYDEDRQIAGGWITDILP